jgi:ABC-type multidrug transport system fused ATPase/permease subunit
VTTLLLYFITPYGRRFVLLGLVMLVGSVLEGFTIAAFFPVLLAIVQPSAAAQMPVVLRLAFDAALMLPVADPVIAAAALLAAVLTCRALVLFARDALIASTGGRILYDLKQRLMAEYARLPYQFFAAEKHGTLLYQAVVAPEYVAMILQRIPQCLAELLKVAAITAVLLATFPTATLVVAFLGLIYFLGARWLSVTMAYDTGAGRSAAHAEQMEVAQQLFSGIRHLRAYGVEAHWLSQFERPNRAYRVLYTKFLTWLAVPRHVMELVAVLLLLSAVTFGHLTNADAFALWLPALGLFGLATAQLMPSLTALGRMWMEIREKLPDLERVHAVLATPGTGIRSGTSIFSGLRQGIEFNDVTFHYDGRVPVISGLRLVFPRGRATAIAGPSGSGKTTIVNLLLGLLEPTTGTITIDGTPLSAYSLRSWLNHIGFVGQDPFIFHGTVADNIRFGRASFSDEHVRAAVKLAHADEFIDRLPEGYDTVVGDRGAKLSGGQLQRLAIARAVLANPDILILDEPTSALDPASEQRVHEALLDAARNRTVIMVTHDEKVRELVDFVVTLEPDAIQTAATTG